MKPEIVIKKLCVECISNLVLGENSLCSLALDLAEQRKHVMQYTRIRVIEALFTLIKSSISKVIEYNEDHPDFPLDEDTISKYMRKWIILSIIWALGGSLGLKERQEFARSIESIVT